VAGSDLWDWNYHLGCGIGGGPDRRAVIACGIGIASGGGHATEATDGDRDLLRAGFGFRVVEMAVCSGRPRREKWE